MRRSACRTTSCCARCSRTTALLAGAWDGLFRSTDGLHWAQVPGVPNVQSLGVFAGALYAGLGDGGVRRSTDGGLTWPSVSTGLPAGNGVTSFAVFGGTLYASVWIGGVYRFDGVSGPASGCRTASSRACTRPLVS